MNDKAFEASSKSLDTAFSFAIASMVLLVFSLGISAGESIAQRKLSRSREHDVDRALVALKALCEREFAGAPSVTSQEEAPGPTPERSE